jgi:asparagine N-glycosylation enzyme membrane subunit Stt3
MEQENLIQERQKKILDLFKKNISWIFYILLAVILWINIRIRTLPMKINPSTGKPFLWDITRDNWTLGPDLDPFFFLRWAKTIVEQGALPAIDYMRYVPLGYNTLNETRLLPYSIVYLYKFLKTFSDKVTVEYAAVILPVVASVFATIAFFLLVRKIFEDKGKKISNIVALTASAFLITLPSLLPRTIAGIPEKESLGFGLMFFAFYFLISAWKSKSTKNQIILGLVSGLFTALMALIWGGVVFIFTSVAIAGFLAFILEQIDKKELAVYSSWIISSMIFWLPFTNRSGGILGFLTSPSTGSAFIVWVLFICYFLLFKTKLKDNKIFENKNLAIIPKPILTLLISIILLLILSSIFLGPLTLLNISKEIIDHLSRPYEDRLSFTVAENKQPFFKSDWEESFGPTQFILFGVNKNIPPLFFWLFFIGTIILFNEMIKKFNLKEKIILTSSYAVFLLALIFSRTSSSDNLNGSSSLSLIVYIGGYLILLAAAIYVYYKKNTLKETEIFKEIKFDYIFIFSLVFVGIIAARSAIRLIMVLAPIAIIPLSYITVNFLFESLKEKKEEIIRVLLVIGSIILILLSAYTLYYNYLVVNSAAKSHIPSSYTYQWQEAMGWIRENTPKNAVFGHWWDYGYWLQTIGERATMLDGGNSIGYWNYLMGRHVLTGETEEEALEVLYNHNVTHFLIDSTEIGKYSAYSNIGSDENYDRFSWIGSFVMDEAQTVETNNKTLFVYKGGVGLDEDIIYDESSNKRTIIPGGKSGVGLIVVPKVTNAINNTNLKNNQSSEKTNFEQPYVIIGNNIGRYEVKLRYLFINNELIDFSSGINATAFIFPSLSVNSQGGASVNQIGAAMFLSPRNMRALWVRLYLLNQGKQFKLIHTEPNAIITSLRSQGLNIGDFVYYQGIQGPIKIWEINYTGNEKYNPEYVQPTYPEKLSKRIYA